MIPLSKELSKLLRLPLTAEKKTDLRLADLRAAVNAMMPPDAPVLPDIDGTAQTTKIVAQLSKICSCDSAVRDVITSGHLAKFLLRQDILLETGGYKLVALPNVVIDRISQLERARFFESGQTLHVALSESQIDNAGRILAREALQR